MGLNGLTQASNPSRSQYELRMHRVQAHIDQHLDQPLDLPALAAVAHFSPYHFHRLFGAWMGETLGDYLTRRRLERGAQRLRGQPGATVLSIALGVGFGSAEAFARAFKARFGCSPTQWRNRRQGDSKFDQAILAQAAEHGLSHHFDAGKPMNVRLVTREPVRMAYMRYQGAYGPELGRFWAETFNPWLKSQNLGPVSRFGLAHDDASLVPPEQCRYDAGVAVPDSWVPNGGALIATLDGGLYAVTDFAGTADQIGGAWAQLMSQWLPSSGLQIAARPCFEHYRPEDGFDVNTGWFECELCLPVEPL